MLLDAAWGAFEDIISASGNCADTDEGFFTALVYILAAAADGRDAIIAAPSLPARQPSELPSGPGRAWSGGSVLDVAATLAALSGLLAARLSSAARAADDPGDQEACLIGARCAREINALLAGTQP